MKKYLYSTIHAQGKTSKNMSRKKTLKLVKRKGRRLK